MEAMYWRILHEAVEDLNAARDDRGHTAITALSRLRLEAEIAYQNERSARLPKPAGEDMPEEEFLAALEAESVEMPDAHLEVFVREWHRRARVYPPPSLN